MNLAALDVIAAPAVRAVGAMAAIGAVRCLVSVVVGQLAYLGQVCRFPIANIIRKHGYGER